MSKFPRPALTVDIVALTVLKKQTCILLICRSKPPCKYQLALPGGFVNVKNKSPEDQGEDLPAAAARELHEETNLRVAQKKFVQMGTFGKPGRDPRQRSITVVFFTRISSAKAAKVKAHDDAGGVFWIPISKAKKLDLAFDHQEIIAQTLRKIRHTQNK